MDKVLPGFQEIHLGGGHSLYQGKLPGTLPQGEGFFQTLWNLHPEEFHDIKIHGRTVKTPRWQQAYGKDYQYSGSRNNALPIPDLLVPFLDWTKEAIDPRLDGLLLNWYDGQLGHYIGKHRDSTQGMAKDAPIATLSFGEQRVFRMRPWKGKGFVDFEVHNGSVLLLPYATNQAWTHEVPASKKLRGRRVSLTLRAFKDVA